MKPELRPEGKPRTSGIIVTYQPAHDELLRLVDAIHPQLDVLFIIDNGDGSYLPECLWQSEVKITCLGENYGIAYAQNVGIREARSWGTEFVLFLDQDSVPAANMLSCLRKAYDLLTIEKIPVAAVGPSYIDPRQGEIAPFVYRHGLTLKRRIRQKDCNTSETDFLIASGCLISSQVLSEVGPMEEGLFIDYVDIEWGLRAQSKGYRSFGVHDALMTHSLGDKWVKFRGRRVPVHSPLRHYYHTRNAIWLARRPWIGWCWRMILVQRVILQIAFFSVFAAPRREHARMMLLGVWHGLKGNTGRL